MLAVRATTFELGYVQVGTFGSSKRLNIMKISQCLDGGPAQHSLPTDLSTVLAPIRAFERGVNGESVV